MNTISPYLALEAARKYKQQLEAEIGCPVSLKTWSNEKDETTEVLLSVDVEKGYITAYQWKPGGVVIDFDLAEIKKAITDRPAYLQSLQPTTVFIGGLQSVFDWCDAPSEAA